MYKLTKNEARIKPLLDGIEDILNDPELRRKGRRLSDLDITYSNNTLVWNKLTVLAEKIGMTTKGVSGYYYDSDLLERLRIRYNKVLIKFNRKSVKESKKALRTGQN